MGYSPADIKHSALIRRKVGIWSPTQQEPVAGLQYGVTDKDPTSPLDDYHQFEGSSHVNQQHVYEVAISTDAEALAHDGTTAKATVAGYDVTAEYVNYHKCEVTHLQSFANDAQCSSWGYSRGEREFVADSDATKISGRCRVSTDLLTGIIPPPSNPTSIQMLMRAEASIGSGKAFIEAKWQGHLTPARWEVTWRKFWLQGTTGHTDTGSYEVMGYELSEEIAWEFILNAGDSLFASSFQGKSHWTDQDWDWENTIGLGALHITRQLGPGKAEGFVSRKAETLVDQQYISRY